MADPLFKSTLLAQSPDPLENQKSALDLLKKVNDVHALSAAGQDGLQTSIDALTTAFAASLPISGSNANGRWLKLSDGTMIQWSSTAAVAATDIDPNRFGSTSGNIYLHSFAITFPIPFVGTGPEFITAQNIIDGSANAGAGVTRIGNINSTGFTLIVWGNTTSGGIVKAYWMALGKWK
jgi:hypothetical protein